MICTGHKMMWYAGSWVVCMRPNLIKSLTPWVWGGWAIQDVSVSGHTFRTDIQRREAGTPDVGAAISLWAACTFLSSHELIDLDPLIDYLWIQLESIWATILWQPDHRVPLISFVIDWNIVYIAEQLAQHNICVRVWWHCAHPLSHFLGIWPTIRLSLYYYNTMEDCTKFISVLRLILWK